MNRDLNLLQPYPFEKLARLKGQVTPPASLPHIALSIGEPKHEPPSFALEVLHNNAHLLSNYPTTKGTEELRAAIGNWLTERFNLQGVDANSQVLPVNGTREALFSFTQAMIDREASNPLIVSPNPFYQIYEGAAFLAGGKPNFIPCEDHLGGMPDFDAVPESVWKDCQLLFICTPGNPTGKVIPLETLQKLIALADEHDFIIASDECYSEIYFDEDNPPVGLLQACASTNRHDYKRCVVFHSLSKRSNMPGLRSGFVAGDADILSDFLRYRTYHGCAMPIPSQEASIALWQDERHVLENRQQYREKFSRVIDILSPLWPISSPEAAFYLWPETPIDDETLAQRLFAEQHITVLPGRYLGRTVNGRNPGENRIRMALVASVEECVEAANRIRNLIEKL
ncbi:succinyldiaminopimelate transaminase [Hahella sp. CCB-MM4]|uniref:succinyldiaminopimelate transaminase n=1 Tax=Hahella sp. (strain CCB-MM4) TaxID=1926491 RepID=UPI000B9AB2B3|nr:succinyldiaminopimelate transaminase [Hahella sp. CCB-MM4]OZG70487.1 succinyldiaminopimelate transaminase [Hahella sp. CCB-MM4]